MRARIGLSLGHDALRAVVVHGGRITWAGEVAREPGTPSVDEIVALLAEAPLPRWPRPVLGVAVGPHASQVKLLQGLPPLTDTEVLSAIVHERPTAFFLQNGTPVRTTGVRLAGEGVAWSAAIDAPYVQSVRDAAAAMRLRISFVAPSAVVLPRVLHGEQFVVRDGPVALEVTRDRDGFSSVRRVPAATADAGPPQPVSALLEIDEDAGRFADAYGAAVAAPGDPLTLGPRGDVPWEARRRRWRIIPPAVLAAAGAIALLLSPLKPHLDARRTEAELRTLQASEQWRLTVDVLAQRERVTGALRELEGFAASRPRQTRLLADLTRALPDSAAVERIDIQGDEARLVIVSPRVNRAIAALRAAPGVSEAALVGEVAQTASSAGPLQRATVRVRTAAPAPTSPANPTNPPKPARTP
jgi:Tfp pilus assembly protein PilN